MEGIQSCELDKGLVLAGFFFHGTILPLAVCIMGIPQDIPLCENYTKYSSGPMSSVVAFNRGNNQ